MIFNNFNSVLKKTLLFSMLFFSVTTLKAQLTGTKMIPGDYASLDLAIADLNTQGVGAGGVVLNLLSTNPQTAPLGGYIIGGAGSLVLTTTSATNTITISGNNNVITAPSSQVSGQLFDGIFKIIGADYVTIQGFTLNENAANTTTTAATNNMTEWGIALLYASTTDGCQNVSVLNNTIALGATYQNAMGIYANSTHGAGTPTASATATGLAGGSHNLSIKGNTISNVNLGIVVVGPTAAADMNNNISLGGATSGEGNTITYGLTGTFSSYANVSGTVNGILVRNTMNATVSNNTLTSNGTVTLGTLNGIQFPASSNTPSGTFTQNINNNTFTLKSNLATGAVFGINLPSGSSTVTSSLNVNNNQFNNIEYASATASGAVNLIFNANPFLTTSISNNSFNNLTCKTTGSFTFISNDYAIPSATGSVTVSNNNIVTAFSKTGAGGTVTCYLTSTSPSSTLNSTKTYNNNNFSNITVTGATTVNGLLDIEGASGGGSQKTISNNTFTNWICGTSSVTVTSINYSINTNYTLNTINNISGQGAITGVSIGSSNGAGTFNITNNTITNLSSTGTGGNVLGITGGSNAITTLNINSNTINTFSSTGASSTVAGVNLTSAPVTANVSSNTIHTLTSSGITSPLVRGIVCTGTTSNIFNNKIYNLSCSGAITTTNGAVNGILYSGGTTAYIYNNVIGELNSPTASLTDAIRGINLTSTTSSSNINVSFNSIYLNATSTGANFGTSGIFHTGSTTATTAQLNLRNNIIINESASAGTGLTVTFRRGTAASTNLNASSNNNMLYAGAPSATKLIYTDGTTSQQSLLNYQTGVLPVGHDANTITGEAAFTGSGYGTAGNFFISLSGSSADFLKPVVGISSQAESGAQNISGITADYSVVTRAGNAGYAGTGTNPDMGAFEFEGVSPAPVVTLNSVTPSTTSQCVASARLISVNATTVSGTITSVNIGYSINGVAQANIAMTNTTGNTWEGNIPVPTPANATIAWGVSATNSLGLSSSYIGTSYSDEPLTGVTATATASITTTCANDPSALTAILSKPGSSVSGAGSGTSSSSGISPFYHGYGGVKTQYIYRASELTAMGFSAGNFTSIAINITTLGTPTLNSFTINVGQTAQTAAVANTAILAGLTEVYNNPAQLLTTGSNIFTFTTPFNWDGTSNIVLSFNYSNVNTGGTSSTVTTDPSLAFTSSLAIYADNASASCLFTAPASGQACMGTNSNTTTSTRPTITFTGNKPPLITSVTWFDGATTVGTSNPLTVNPTVTTTYSASITSAGCTVSPAPTVSVTVNPLPTAPTVINSAQCGTQIPTASVTSTSGLPTPTFKWYDAAVSGTVLQNSTSTTYTSNVAATTTFYVAEINTATGCESPKVAVTVTVSTADGILATSNNATICIGSSVNLTATNTNSTPNQTYAYTWTGTAGSGFATANGSSVIVTPTLPGTYTYNLAGVDGGCNAVSSVNLIVNPFTATISPVNASCNAGNDGSFTLGITTCGTAPYTYSIDGGSYGSIPTNLVAGTYSVLVKDANGFISEGLPLTIAQPSTTITNPTVTYASVCQNSGSALVSASATTSVPTSASTVVNFNVTAQPAESFAAPGNIVASATIPSLPAGSIITSLVINYNGITPNASGEYQSDVRLGLSGAFTNANAAGVGTTGFGTVIGVPFNYTRTINSPVGFPLTGGTINLTYHNDFNDATSTIDALFALGNVASLVINYTSPTPATITWWDTPTGGTQIGTGSPFETVGTSVLPTTATTGVYTLYAQGQNGACPSPGRTATTVTVNAPSASTTTISACGSYTWTNGTNYALSGTYTQTLTNAVGCDSIATLALTIKQPTSSSTPVTACTSYTWTNGTTYNTSGTYTQTLTNAVGCDSIATLVLTINQPSASSTPVTACDSYTWTNGITYVTSGTYTQTLTNAAGCDSIATLVLTINNSTTGIDVITACDSHTWIDGVNYTTSNSTATFTLTNAAGCDSIVTLNLTINNSTTGTDVITACDSYTWIDGVNYTTSNSTATFTLTNAAGCDSIVTLNLTINNSTTGTDVITACDSYTWIDGVNYTTNNSTATFTLTNAAGCDSIVTLNLTINNSNTGTDVITACDSYTWIDGVTYTTNNSTAIFNLTNAAGCDSIVTLNLTITATPVATATDNGNATITAGTAATYQWIDCATGTAIAGATNQTFTVTANGLYAVIESNGSCSDTSACVTIDYMKVSEMSVDVIGIYPNPTRDNVTVTMTNANASIEVIDAQGKLLKATQVVNGDKIDLSSYETGMYIFRVTTENGTSIFRVSKN